MVGHGFEFDDVAVAFGANIGDELLKSGVNVSSEDWSPIFRTPDDVKRAAVDDIVVGPDFNHVDTI